MREGGTPSSLLAISGATGGLLTAPTQLARNFLNIDPFLMKVVPFESSRSQLSNDIIEIFIKNGHALRKSWNYRMKTMEDFGEELILAVVVGRNGCHHKTQHRRKPINRGSHGIYSWDHGENSEKPILSTFST